LDGVVHVEARVGADYAGSISPRFPLGGHDDRVGGAIERISVLLAERRRIGVVGVDGNEVIRETETGERLENARRDPLRLHVRLRSANWRRMQLGPPPPSPLRGCERATRDRSGVFPR